ncbi:unnamed protein product [Trifolium pratense]|uniref:Uncharacterized protein n=1 Tax=Trifolium pratense TaxID=57577 RepID=A0ACB0L2T3_TRIPR|nr:unnamed protein product [Trifolium pratense]
MEVAGNTALRSLSEQVNVSWRLKIDMEVSWCVHLRLTKGMLLLPCVHHYGQVI